jgi:hypothetical protein
MPEALKDIIYQVIEAYYEFEKENRIKINEPLHYPFCGIDVANMQPKILRNLGISAGYSDIENCAIELVQEGRAKYVPIQKAYTSVKAPN